MKQPPIHVHLFLFTILVLLPTNSYARPALDTPEPTPLTRGTKTVLSQPTVMLQIRQSLCVPGTFNSCNDDCTCPAGQRCQYAFASVYTCCALLSCQQDTVNYPFSTSTSSRSSSARTTSHTSSATRTRPAAAATPQTAKKKKKPSAGSIIGKVIGSLIVAAAGSWILYKCCSCCRSTFPEGPARGDADSDRRSVDRRREEPNDREERPPRTPPPREPERTEAERGEAEWQRLPWDIIPNSGPLAPPQ